MIVLLHSGGVDSQAAWLMNQHWKPVYVCLGGEGQDAELQALADIRQMMPTFQPCIIKLGFTPEVEYDGHIAHRNALLLTAALAAFPHAEAVAYGALLGEGSGDKSATFARHLSRAYSAGEGRPIRVLRPLRYMTKAQAIRRACEYPGGHTLTATTSCYHGTACQMCQACFRLGIANYLCGFRAAPPPLPNETYGVWATLRANKLRRWPGMALANMDVVHAYARYHLRILVGKEPTLKGER
jgi:7-cyano-7-deazaguanine synthase in queuosine biosynthesis